MLFPNSLLLTISIVNLVSHSSEYSNQQRIQNLLVQRAKKLYESKKPITAGFSGRNPGDPQLEEKVIKDILTDGWSDHGADCNYTKYKDSYAWFLTLEYANATYLTQTLNNQEFKKDNCNFFLYQQCHPVTETCQCFPQHVYVETDKSCKLIEGAVGCNRDWYKGEPFAVKIENPHDDVKNFQIKRELFYNTQTQLSCASGSECLKRNDTDVCVPSDAKFYNLKEFIKANHANLEKAPWIQLGSPCQIHKNYRFTTVRFEKLLENITSLFYDDYLEWSGKMDMCNPYAYTGCHPQVLKCKCFLGFKEVEGKCQLAPGHNGSCEWELKVPYIINPENVPTFVPDKVQIKCVDNAECKDKVCTCKPGMECAKADDFFIGDSWTIQPSAQLTSISTIIFILTNQFE